MSNKILSFASRWKDLFLIGSALIGCLTVIASSNKAQGRQEQINVDVLQRQTTTEKTVSGIDIKQSAFQSRQDTINIRIISSLDRITEKLNDNEIEVVRLLKSHNMQPHQWGNIKVK